MKRSRRLLILLCAIALAAACGFLAWRLWPRPAYAPPAPDPLAQSAEGWPQSIASLETDNYTIALNPNLQVNGRGECEIWFMNPVRNTAYLMLDVRLGDSGLLIYRTGLVAPGEGIRQFTFVKEALDKMALGTQTVVLTVYSLAVDGYVSMGEIDLQVPLTYQPEAQV